MTYTFVTISKQWQLVKSGVWCLLFRCIILSITLTYIRKTLPENLLALEMLHTLELGDPIFLGHGIYRLYKKK